jgi:hypothetical protein
MLRMKSLFPVLAFFAGFMPLAAQAHGVHLSRQPQVRQVLVESGVNERPAFSLGRAAERPHNGMGTTCGTAQYARINVHSVRGAGDGART